MSTPLQNIAKPNTSPSTWSLSEPLLCYHGRIVRTFHALPKEGAVVELIQRIVLIALIPFVYPLLGLLALIGRVTQHPSTEKGRQDPISPVPKDPVTDIERKQTLFKDLENVLSSYLTDILRAKLFIRAESGETHFVRSFTFNESLTSPVLASNLLEPEDYRKIVEWESQGTGKWRYLLVYQEEDGIWHTVNQSKSHMGIEDVGTDAEMDEEYLTHLIEHIGCERPESPITLDKYLAI